MDIHQVLDNIIKYCDKNIVNLNAGGCGKLVSLLANEMLKRNLKFEVALVAPLLAVPSQDLMWAATDSEHLLLQLRGEKTYVSAFHTFITYEGTSYNSCGWGGNSLYRYCERKDIELLVEKIRNSYMLRKPLWSEHYNRNQDNKLRKAIKYYFSKLN